MDSVQPTLLEESEPLLRETRLPGEYQSIRVAADDTRLTNRSRPYSDGVPIAGGDGADGEAFDNVPKERRRLGLWSATNLVFNFVIGTGIYATPSLILRSSGSVGIALVMWLIGALIAAAGTVVYIELGTGLPRNGGEKNYLEFIYRKPKYLITCIFIIYSLLTRTSAASSVVFGEYVIHAIGVTPSHTNTLAVALCGLTLVTLLHGTTVQWGIRLQNALGAFKLLVLSAISIIGLLSFAGVPGFQVREEYEKPHNLEWKHIWQGSNLDAYDFVTGLYNIIWSYLGYSHINYALSEVKHPVRTVKYASALALLLVTSVYFSVNIAYFAVISKSDILNSRTIVVSLFFRNLFGEATERLMSAIVALSVLGTILASKFAQGRVIQELGREGILPFSEILASSKPFNAPSAALCVQYVISCAILVLTPKGDIYLFLISFGSYCISLVNTLVAFGVVLLHASTSGLWHWNPPFRAPNSVVFIYLLSNIFLITVPFVPPKDGKNVYENLPYWSHSVTAFAVSLIGYAYWYWFVVWHPQRNKYLLEREWVIQDDGVSRYAFRKVPIK